MSGLAGGWKVERTPDPPFVHDLMCVTSPTGETTAFTFADDSVVWQLLAALIATPPLTAEQEAAVAQIDAHLGWCGSKGTSDAWFLLRPIITGAPK